MIVKLKNGKKYDLDENNGASGGEGNVYFNSGYAFKIYHDKNNMIPNGKFRELSEIKKDNIIKPEELIYDLKDNIIGYTMKHVKNTVALSRIITTDYQKQNNIFYSDIVNIINQIRETISYIHSKNCLVVDVNDANILVDNNLNVFLIDVDSYKTESFPATALQEYAKDYTVVNNAFNPLSDWYSFGLLAVKLFVGLHPYKGRWNAHVKRAKENNLKERSLSNISIFNKDVIFTKSVRDFSIIPTNYYDWFVSLFEKGERSLPPTVFTSSGYSPKEILLRSTSKLSIEKILELNHSIQTTLEGFRNALYQTNGGIYYNNKITHISRGEKALVFDSTDTPYAFKDNDGEIAALNIENGEIINFRNMYTDKLFSFNNILYSIKSNKISELNLINMGKLNLIINKTFHLDQTRMEMFDGVIIQKLINKTFMYILGEKNKIPCLKFQEYDDKKIVNAKYSNNILMIVTLKNNGDYEKRVYKINEFFDEYKLIDKHISDFSDLNFTVNESGVLVYIPSDGLIKVAFNKYNVDKINEIDNQQIRTDMHLYSSCHLIRFYNQNNVYSIKMN